MRRALCLLPVGALALLAPLPAPLSDVAGIRAAHAQEAEEAAPRRGRRGREKKPATPPGMQQAVPVAVIGDWNVFTNGQGKARVCYAIAQPQARSPNTLKRDTAYLFVTVRKAENIQNEVAVMLGFPAKPAAAQGKPGAAAAPSDPSLNIGTARYGLVTKDNNAWLQNPAEETRVVAEMSGRIPKLTVRTTSMRGNPTSDEYALAGFADAMKRAREECK